jgi:glycosyltransferase involved in cell wall biosynthesis
MPTNTQTFAKRVCILIPTYKRNDALLRVLSQCLEFIDKYHGHNCYELCVADSDPNNPMVPLPPHLKVNYSVNPGKGFDENLYYFWLNNVDSYDFIFSMSDDDIFTPGLNPLYLLDAAIDSGHQVVMFNHRYYKWQPNGNIEIGIVVYPDIELALDKKLLLHRLLTTLPSHIATLYSTTLLKITLNKVSEFRSTLHLYAVPVLIAAAANTLLFSDYVLCLYHDEFKKDGAWSVSEDVINGLAEFLKKLKQLLPADLYRIAEVGFFNSYLGANCWLRQQMGQNPRVKSEEQIREMLASS